MMKHKKVSAKLQLYMRFVLYLGILLAAVDFSIFFLNIKAGIILAAFWFFYMAVGIILYYYNKPILMNEMVNFATQYGQIQKKLLRELELAHAVMDEDGKILWTNAAFERISHKEKGYVKSITSIFPSLTKDKLPSEEDRVETGISYEGCDYHIVMKKMSLDEMDRSGGATGQGNWLIAIYLYDETALKIALKEVDDQSITIGLIYLDNYEEALESVEEVRRSLMTALVDRKINKYIAAQDGICKKLEKDKYLIILRKEAIKSLEECRFDLLEEVKTVNIGNEMSVTISIGIGLDGLSFAQNYEFARTAIDLALGRGGDQAVVKSGENITYFGGKSQQIEKNTRVKARVKAHALEEIISSKDQVFIMGHRFGDADSFGSAIGIYRICASLDKNAYIVINEVTTSLQPLIALFKDNPDYEQDMIINSQQAMEMVGDNAALVIVDVNKPSITECPELIHQCKSIVVLDHHRQGVEKVENATLSYVEPYASSASEMVAEILQYIKENVKIRNDEADCLYSGIMIDTNNFVTKTGVRTFEAAAYLRRSGADVTRVRKLFREDVNAYKAKADAVSQAEIYQGAYAISICTAEDVASPTIIGAQAANELLNIRGVKASFVLTDYQNRIYVSARSIDEVNVQIIMEKMGGGGHMNVAACQMENVSIAEAIRGVKDTLDQMLQEGEIE